MNTKHKDNGGSRLAAWTLALAAASLSAMPHGALAADPAARPRIGLVLGGGGARGSAHIGVLEVMERLRVPVDCVAGTSMGSLVAGVYAVGLTPAEMLDKLAPVDWHELFDDDPESADMNYRSRRLGQRFYPKLELGITDNGVEPVTGVVAGQKIKLFFNMMVGDDRGQRTIESLRLPVSIIATDIGTGKRVVLREGSLSAAMRASMSVPGLLDPVKIGEHYLVDGGLVDNVPIGEARSRCNADVVIAVDVGTPLMKPEEVTNILSVAGQMINILTNQNVEASLATLKPGDVFIRPDLSGISAGDFPRYREAVERGRRAAEEASDQLARYAVSPEQYAAWHGRIRMPERPAPVVDEIQIAEMEYVSPQAVERLVEVRPGEPLDTKKLNKSLQAIYGEGHYQGVDYALLPTRERNILRITPVEKSWGPDYLLFGLNLSSNVGDWSAYELRVAYRRTWLNAYGGEWLTGVQVGEDSRVFTEFYQPLDERQRFFVAPGLAIGRSALTVYQDNERIGEFTADRAAARLDAGVNFGAVGQAKLGYYYSEQKTELSTGVPGSLPEGEQTVRGWNANLDFEQFDRLFFPTRGWAAIADVFRADQDDYTRGNLSVSAAVPVSKYVINGRLRVAGSLSGTLPSYDAVAFGGPFNMGGYAQNQVVGDELAYGSLRLERIVGQMPLGLTGDLRLGVAAEAGKVNGRYTETHLDGWLKSYSIYFAGETPVGPLYLGYGNATGGASAFYLFIGTP
jgi:NTE family protein